MHSFPYFDDSLPPVLHVVLALLITVIQIHVRVFKHIISLTDIQFNIWLATELDVKFLKVTELR